MGCIKPVPHITKVTRQLNNDHKTTPKSEFTIWPDIKRRIQKRNHNDRPVIPYLLTYLEVCYLHLEKEEKWKKTFSKSTIKKQFILRCHFQRLGLEKKKLPKTKD